MSRSIIFRLSVLFYLLCSVAMVRATEFVLQPHQRIVGHLQFHQIKKGENFIELAQQYEVGYDALRAANPYLDSEHPLVGAVAIIPSQFIIPKPEANHIIINLAAKRLFYFTADDKKLFTYPIGIGEENWQSPQGLLYIMQKVKNPVWIVPESIFKYRQKNGDPVPHIVQSGPDNPLGYFALRLSRPTYLIHGTNDPSSIGRRSSAGCIHLFPKDIKQLFSLARVKMRVHFINDPFQVAWQNNKLYIQIYPALIEQKKIWGNYGAWQLLQADVQQEMITHHIQLTSHKILELRRILQEQLAIPYALMAYKSYSVWNIIDKGY